MYEQEDDEYIVKKIGNTFICHSKNIKYILIEENMVIPVEVTNKFIFGPVLGRY